MGGQPKLGAVPAETCFSILYIFSYSIFLKRVFSFSSFLKFSNVNPLFSSYKSLSKWTRFILIIPYGPLIFSDGGLFMISR